MRKNFRLSNATLQKIEQRDLNIYETETEFVEAAISFFSYAKEQESVSEKVKTLEEKVKKLEVIIFKTKEETNFNFE